MEKSRLASSEFGALLRYHHLAAGVSQEVLAEQGRMSVNGISALQRDHRNRSPYRETVAGSRESTELTASYCSRV